MEQEVKKKHYFLPFLFVFVLLVLGSLLYTFYNLSSIGKNNQIDFEVKEGETYLSIANRLESEKLIHSAFFYKLYIKLNTPKSLQAGIYPLNQNMDIKELIKELEKGSSYNPYAIRITFKEGLSFMQFAEVIEENTNHKKSEVYDIVKDTEYIDSLINQYWFLENDIKNKKIYYALEGYLYPETYEFTNKDVEIKVIIETMLKEMEKALEPYKEDITSSKYTIHQIITLSSMIQSEGNNIDDFKKMASVFINRLNKNMKLQSCASAYYGAKKIMGRDAFDSAHLKQNNYNTYVIASLPVGPISNPGLEAIKATLKPEKTDYLYFASDKSKKVYFSKTYEEHATTVKELKQAGNWYGS